MPLDVRQFRKRLAPWFFPFEPRFRRRRSSAETLGPSAARALVDAVRTARAQDATSAEQYSKDLEELAQIRGLPFALPLLTAGVGRGASVQLRDGKQVLDLVSGIGPYVFGHDDPDLLETAAIAAAADVAFQGHVLPGPEYFALTQKASPPRGPRLAHVWLSLSARWPMKTPGR